MEKTTAALAVASKAVTGLQALVEVVEWSENRDDPAPGTAAMELYELPAGLVRRVETLKEEQPDEPSNSGSSGCKDWLPRQDSNLRPGD